jgi:hypothetical protein
MDPHQLRALEAVIATALPLGLALLLAAGVVALHVGINTGWFDP